MKDEKRQELVRPPEWLGLVPPGVEADHVVGDGQAEVEDGDDDGHPVPRDEQPHQSRLKHVGREEGEKHDDQGEHQTDILDTEKRKRFVFEMKVQSFLSFKLTQK